MAVSVPLLTRLMTLSLCIVPVRFAETFTPLAHVAVTVPDTDEAVCVVMSHFTSEQLPSGSPAIVDEPHAPANAEADGVAVVDPVEDDAPVALPPAASPVPDGDVGPVSLFSNEQPVDSVAASIRLKRAKVFIRDLTLVYRHMQFWHAPQVQ